MEMQSHLFLSSYLKFRHFFLLRGKLRFSSDLLFCRMVVTDERLQVRRLLIFFRIFLKMSSKKMFFSGEEVVTLKLFSLLPAHSQEIAKSSKLMGWFDDFSFFFNIQMLMRKSDVFEVGPDT